MLRFPPHRRIGSCAHFPGVLLLRAVAVGGQGDEGKRRARDSLTLRRALRAPEFWLLLVASAAATAGVAWWVTVPLVVAGLSIVSMPKYVALWPRAREVGAELEWWNDRAVDVQ